MRSERNRYRWQWDDKPGVTPGFWIGMRNSLFVMVAFVLVGLTFAKLWEMLR